MKPWMGCLPFNAKELWRAVVLETRAQSSCGPTNSGCGCKFMDVHPQLSDWRNGSVASRYSDFYITKAAASGFFDLAMSSLQAQSNARPD
jgi:hypothetical protein